MIARLCTLLNIPLITTASEPAGSNGPLMPEIHELAPHAVYVPRKGEVNAWDNQDFVAQVRSTGRKTLVMAGVWTSVCVMFPALHRCGLRRVRRHRCLRRPQRDGVPCIAGALRAGGVKPTTTNAVLSELHRTWARPEAADLAQLYALVTPNYAAVMESCARAQQAARDTT
jgi:hypothetical protein